MKINKKMLEEAAKKDIISIDQTNTLYDFLKESNQKNNLNSMSIIGIVFSIIAFIFLFGFSFSFDNIYVPSVVCVLSSLFSFKLFKKFNNKEQFNYSSVFDSISIGLLFLAFIILFSPDFSFESSFEMSVIAFSMSLVSFVRFKKHRLPIQITQVSLFLIIGVNSLIYHYFNYNDDLLFHFINLFMFLGFFVLGVAFLKINKFNKEQFQVLQHFFALYLFLNGLIYFNLFQDLSSFFVALIFVSISFVVKNKSYLIYGMIVFFITLGFNLESEIGGFFTTLIFLFISALFVYLSRFVYKIENKINDFVKSKGFDF